MLRAPTTAFQAVPSPRFAGEDVVILFVRYRPAGCLSARSRLQGGDALQQAKGR
jgi:hypothetical protein